MISSTVMPVGWDGSSAPSPRSEASTGSARHNVSSNRENVRKCKGTGWNFIRDGPLRLLYSIRGQDRDPRHRSLQAVARLAQPWAAILSGHVSHPLVMFDYRGYSGPHLTWL